MGGSANDYVSSLGVQDSGIYVAGVFASPTATFGPTTLTNMGGSDFFVSKLTDAGSTSNWQWAKATGGSGDDRSDALAVRGNRVYVVGSFTSPTILFHTSLVNATSATVGYLASLVDFPLATPADLPGVRFTLFPNPAHHTAALTGATAPTATLLDGVGRVVRTVPVTQGAATLDVRGLPAGLYTVRAGGRARRLVVE